VGNVKLVGGRRVWVWVPRRVRVARGKEKRSIGMVVAITLNLVPSAFVLLLVVAVVCIARRGRWGQRDHLVVVWSGSSYL
jgi:hypothetical protein